MRANEAHIGRLADERRRALSGEFGLPLPFAPLLLRDATLLVPRYRHGPRHVSLHHPDVHIVGRAYGRDELFLQAGGPWRPVSTTAGAVTVLPAGFDITWDIPVANDFSMVILPDARLQACSDELGNGHHVDLAERIVVDDPTTSQILGLINQELACSDRASTLFVERAIDLLCLQLVRAHSSHGPIEDRRPRRGLAAWQVKRVTSYMCDRLDHDISLGELAVLVGLSRFHFCTAFRLATACTPHQWLTALRMDRARQLLADPTLRITDVALAVGYATPSAFSATFRRVVGASPSAYRRRYASSDRNPDGDR